MAPSSTRTWTRLWSRVSCSNDAAAQAVDAAVAGPETGVVRAAGEEDDDGGSDDDGVAEVAGFGVGAGAQFVMGARDAGADLGDQVGAGQA